jgi:hypothetical protein
MGLITPIVGSDIGAWGDKLNTICAQVDNHDHTDGKGLPITPDAMNIDDDLSMAGNGLTATGLVEFAAIAALTTGLTTLFVSAADNELYWRNASGTNVKLTLASSINTSLVGGIVGDYSSVGAQVAYDDANKVYTFKTQTSTWARLASGPVRIYEYNTSETVYAEIAVAAALAASYTITLPAALPGAQVAMQIAADGTVSFSNTFTSTVSAPDLHYTTAQVLQVPAALAEDPIGAHAKYRSSNGGHVGWELGNNVDPIIYAIPGLRQGDTITGFKVRLHKDSDNTSTLTAVLYKHTSVGDLETPITTKTNNENAPGDTNMTSGLITQPVGSNFGEQYFVRVSSTGSISSERLGVLEVSVKRGS